MLQQTSLHYYASDKPLMSMSTLSDGSEIDEKKTNKIQ